MGNSVEYNYEINRFDWTLAAVLEMVHWLVVEKEKKKMITRHWTDRHALHACSLILFFVAMMAPLPSFPSSFLRYRRPSSYPCSKNIKIPDLLSIAFNADALFQYFFLSSPSVENCKNWQYLHYPAKQRALLVSELYQIAASLINTCNWLVIRRISLICSTVIGITYDRSVKLNIV